MPSLFYTPHDDKDTKNMFVSIKMPATEGELRNLMMDMKKAYFDGWDYTIQHKDLYTLLSWMEDIINDSVKLDNYEIREKKGKKKWK